MLSIVMPSVIKLNVTNKPFVLNVVMLRFVRLNVVMLCVVAPHALLGNPLFLIAIKLGKRTNTLAYFGKICHFFKWCKGMSSQIPFRTAALPVLHNQVYFFIFRFCSEVLTFLLQRRDTTWRA